MDLLEESKVLERIELLAKFVCVDESSTEELQVALIWIGEMVEQIRGDIALRNEKTTESRWF
ncbi:hypothetical protein [Pectobacterium sp. B1J-3]|uniref:hypothetical protein n=1 Tax=Pectobacterium sp. B1J-3 TaxID=3385371 RepID=UPI003906D433